MKKIDIKKLQGSLPAGDDGEHRIPYQDIEDLAVKINEIIDRLPTNPMK